MRKFRFRASSDVPRIALSNFRYKAFIGLPFGRNVPLRSRIYNRKTVKVESLVMITTTLLFVPDGLSFAHIKFNKTQRLSSIMCSTTKPLVCHVSIGTF